MIKEKLLVLFDSDEAAQIKTVTGWVDRAGRFYGNDEQLARYAGCTHKLCPCGNTMERHYLKCADCRDKDDIDRYNALPYKEWDGSSYVYSKTADRYFSGEEELIEYLEEYEADPAGLMLVLCTPNEYTQIGSDHWQDIFADDSDGELPTELQAALDNLNAVVGKLSPASYSPGRTRTSYEL